MQADRKRRKKEELYMPTVDVRITSMYPPGEVGSIRGYASATIDSCLAIRGIKVMDGGERGLFISMPSRKTTEGYKEVCFPVTAEFREQLHNAVLSAYQQALEQSVAQQTGAPQTEAPEQAGEQPGLQM